MTPSAPVSFQVVMETAYGSEAEEALELQELNQRTVSNVLRGFITVKNQVQRLRSTDCSHSEGTVFAEMLVFQNLTSNFVLQPIRLFIK